MIVRFSSFLQIETMKTDIETLLPDFRIFDSTRTCDFFSCVSVCLHCFQLFSIGRIFYILQFFIGYFLLSFRTKTTKINITIEELPRCFPNLERNAFISYQGDVSIVVRYVHIYRGTIPLVPRDRNKNGSVAIIGATITITLISTGYGEKSRNVVLFFSFLTRERIFGFDDRAKPREKIPDNCTRRTIATNTYVCTRVGWTMNNRNDVQRQNWFPLRGPMCRLLVTIYTLR